MRTFSIQGLPAKRRQKVLIHDAPEPEGPTGNEVKTETLYSGITNGTERNQLIGGNYAPKDEQLPTSGGGYQNVGRVIEVGPDVQRTTGWGCAVYERYPCGVCRDSGR